MELYTINVLRLDKLQIKIHGSRFIRYAFQVDFIFYVFYRGSAISKLIGYNAARLEVFETSVTMYVYEEYIDGKKLTEIINETHENVKYLPGHKLPTNVVSIFSFITSCFYR